MYFNDLRKGRDLARPNSPDRFISNDKRVSRCALWYRGGQLSADNIKRSTRLTIAEAFTDAQDRNQTSIARRNRFSADILICLAVGFAPFRVANDNIFCPRIFDHRG